MITAETARANVKTYETAMCNEVTEQVKTKLEQLGKLVEMNSNAGMRTACCAPYSRNTFTSYRTLDLAEKLFQNLLESLGYKVISNDWRENILTIKW